MDLKGKVIVVTGASRGLGLSISLALAAKGASLALVDLDEATLADASKLCQKVGGDARFYCANVGDESAIVKLYADVVNDFGTLDGTVNNAGNTRLRATPPASTTTMSSVRDR